MTPFVCKRDCRGAALFYINITHIRLIFNKSYAKKWKINNDEETSKLIRPKPDIDELQESSHT